MWRRHAHYPQLLSNNAWGLSHRRERSGTPHLLCSITRKSPLALEAHFDCKTVLRLQVGHQQALLTFRSASWSMAPHHWWPQRETFYSHPWFLPLLPLPCIYWDSKSYWFYSQHSVNFALLNLDAIALIQCVSALQKHCHEWIPFWSFVLQALLQADSRVVHPFFFP